MLLPLTDIAERPPAFHASDEVAASPAGFNSSLKKWLMDVIPQTPRESDGKANSER